MPSSTTFLAAARGWQHPAWGGAYYPEDLPGDWRLSYYSNEFRAVVVPACTWAGLTAAEVQRWEEDTHAGFRFYLEVAEPGTDWPALHQRLAPIAEQIGGVILRPPAMDLDLAELEAALRQAADLGPLALDLPPGGELGPQERRLLQELGVNPVWWVEAGQPDWVAGPLAVARVDGAPRTPRAWRAVVEGCLNHAADDETILLMLEGDNPDIEALRVTTMIADMLDDAGVNP